MPADPTPDPGYGVNRSEFSFFRTWSCCISNYRESRMQQHGSKYFARRPLLHPPPPTLEMGSVGQNRTFSERDHVAYQIKDNYERSNVVANILPVDTPTLGMGSIGQNSTFPEHGHVTYQFKGTHFMHLNGSKYLPTDPYPPPPSNSLGLWYGVSRLECNFFRKFGASRKLNSRENFRIYCRLLLMFDCRILIHDRSYRREKTLRPLFQRNE